MQSTSSTARPSWIARSPYSSLASLSLLQRPPRALVKVSSAVVLHSEAADVVEVAEAALDEVAVV